MTDFNSAISSIESGGRYDAMGPFTGSGDRAYGKYQIMGANVGPWSAAVFGHAMTPQQFLADPQAQVAVFNEKFGEYVKKYGPGGAARAWLAGEGGMNNPNARDVLGTSVADYERKFIAALHPGQTASAGPFQPPGARSAAAPAAPDNVAALFTNFGGDSLPLVTPAPDSGQVPAATTGDTALMDPALQMRAFQLPRLADRYARKQG